jgi:endoglucanase
MKRFYIFPLFGKGPAHLSIGLLMYSALFGQTLPTAVETAKAMTIGWNLGNTLEAIGGETAWGNPLATQRLIDSVKAAGFNTVRIPCAWDNHADQTTGIIDAAWIARVKDVADYCIKDSMYAIINIHWDNGWLENNCTADKKDAVNAKQKTYWTQIASCFKSYNGHLLFAGANEPNVTDAAQMAVLMSYHQTFIDAVRATGGNNGSRVLIVQGPSTDIEKTSKLMNSLPADKYNFSKLPSTGSASGINYANELFNCFAGWE